MAAPTPTEVNETQSFRSTALIDRPVPTFRPSPKITPNPFTGLPLSPGYDAEHHVVHEAPDTVAEATRTNPLT